MESKLITFGFEIEGEFTHKAAEFLAEYGEIKEDGSVDRCDDCVLHDNEVSDLGGEFASKIYKVTSLDKALCVFSGIEGEYHWNTSAGFHVHLGFSPINPPEFRSYEFADYFLRAFRKKFPEEYKRRVGGRYSRGTFNQKQWDDLATGSDTDRYCAVNFNSNYDTIEVRLMPSAHPWKMYDMLEFLIKTAQKFPKRQLRRKFLGELEEKEKVASYLATIENEIPTQNIVEYV